MMAIRRLGSLAVVALGITAAACENKVPEPSAEPRAAAPREPEKPEPADLIKEDITIGTGPEAREGDKVKVHYTGRLLKTNFMFDSSVGKDPFEFQLGKGEVIKGWDEGVAGMKVGGKRKLTIPSKLGYGDDGSPPKIPGKATLVFDVELLDVISPSGKPADAKGESGKETKDAPKKDAPKK
ncbi:FKBP-type peptidyl-prolyl cis-trans isomerase [Polyangium fumosum]|uniref:Peptidyl-prolyl cis-trans isomerase n=1 Tax=Polyangium fumosum TaxID=889272 RepID=A0A4U1J8P9_9BACT|nr:FKBP-type peptidyl-prolyl cis-trans isomerase [Polyangium fumosum]TKD04330.1 peptidylprolyl isomerase [Polyangium fumosum]